MKKDLIFRPAKSAENRIINFILNKEWGVGYKLLPERELSLELGVTRSTLREVLQRLAREGWLSISHGKPTVVNDVIHDGGLGILKALTVYNNEVSDKLILDWLEFRLLVFPDLASKSIATNKLIILKLLNSPPKLNDTGVYFAEYDWILQLTLVKLSGNIIAKMLYNDLSEIYRAKGEYYFRNKKAKVISLAYYKKLKIKINTEKEVKSTIYQIMNLSLNFWKKNNSSYKTL